MSRLHAAEELRLLREHSPIGLSRHVGASGVRSWVTVMEPVEALQEEVGAALPHELRDVLADTAGDELRAEFAATLDDAFTLVDLRAAPIGMGLSCGRYDPRAELRRHQYHRVLACRRPPRPPHRLRGLFKPRRRPA